MDKRSRVFSSLIWRLFEQIGAQGVSFVVSIILARLLEPSVYGTVALVIVFITILQVFVDSGMGNALIQKKDADDTDFSSVFYFNVIVCIFLYICTFFSAPLIAHFYDNEELIPIVRVLALLIIISGVKNIQQAYVSRHLLFKKFFFATIGGTLGSAVVGICMALNGYGVWSLVAQHLFNAFVDTVILWITVKWRPRLLFSINRIKGLFSFGWKLLISALIDTGYRELKSLIIGKLYTSADLAFYNRGEQFPKVIVNNINSTIDSVLLPALSSEQDDKDRVRAMTRRSIKISSYIMMPGMVGLAVCAEPLIRIVLTEKWLSSVFFLRIFCFTYAFYPIHTANLNAINAIGRSDIFLKLEIIKKVVGLVALFSTMFISVRAIALVLPLMSIIGQAINAYPNKTLLKYGYVDQLRDILPQIVLSCLMGLIVFCISLFRLNDWITLFVQIPLGAIIYIVGSKLFHIDSFEYMLGIIKSYLGKRKKTA